MGIISHLAVLTMLFGGLASQNDTGYLNQDENDVIYCYQCNTVNDEGCENINSNDTDVKSKYLLPCLDYEKYGGSKPFCRKTTQKVFTQKGLELVDRACGWVRHPRLDCYNTRTEDHKETSCQCFESGCNGATLFHQSVILVTSGLALGLTLGRSNLLQCCL